MATSRAAHSRWPLAADDKAAPYHRRVIPRQTVQRTAPSPPAPDRIAAARAIDIAEAFRDLPGLVLLESARPGRNARWTYLTADPVAVLESPAAGPDPFAVARRLVRGWLGSDARRSGATLRRSSAGSSASSATTSGPAWSGCRRSHRPTRTCPRSVSRSTTGSSPGIDGPATPGWPAARSTATAAGWHAGWTTSTPGSVGPTREPAEPAALGPIVFRSGLDRAAYEAGVERVRRHIADGDIYQANLTRRLEAPFDGEPWDLYRRLRTGDPSLFSAYLDLGPGQLSGRPRALLSASPEPFLSVGRRGPSSRPTRSRARDRAAVTRRAIARSPASSCRAPRTAPRT